MTPTRWARLWIIAAALLLVSAAPTRALTQAPTYDFNMPAEGLGDALRAFGQIAHQQIIFSEDAVRGKRSPRLLGSFTVEQALSLLLAKSGLVIRRTSSGVIYIESENPCCRHESSSRS